MNMPSFFQKQPQNKSQEQHGRQALLGGTYSIVITAVVLAILIAVNVLVSVLPSSVTNLDISASKLYSITSNTKVVVNALDQDVTIYWIVQSGEEDDVIENLLSKYDSLSDHLSVVKRNPDVYPTFAKQYTDETVANNSLVVECKDRSRYIPYSDIYVQEADVYSYSYTTSFDGEGAITSAIDYVTTEELPQLYVLGGHGEEDLPATFADQIAKDNYEVNDLSLLTADEMPQDAACVILYAPQSDISADEAESLIEYVEGGGKLLVMAGPVEDANLDNLYSVLEPYGVTPCEGIVVEQDRTHYAFQMPYVLLPQLSSHAVTDSLLDNNYFVIMPIAQGLNVADNTGSATVTPLLTTTETSFSKKDGYAITTYDKEEGDTDGPFHLAVDVTTPGGGELIWFSSSGFLTDMYNAYSSGANTDLAMNALSELAGQREAMEIRSKSLNYNYLTISDATATLLKVLLIGVFPLAYLGVGILVVWKRRRMQNETV